MYLRFFRSKTLIPKPDYIYIAFDLFPSKKGAATHINHCLKALQASFKTGLLICLGNDDMPAFQFDKERQLYVYRFKKKIVNFLERTDVFQKEVVQLLNSDLCSDLKLAHFRDIWGGIPVIQALKKMPKVYEVNAFASIELPNRYPNINASVISQIKKREHYCVTNASKLITPSQVTKTYIYNTFNIPKKKIKVIPNGVTIYDTKHAQPFELTLSKTDYVLYFGALQKWQGIKTLFKACKELQDLDIRLIICSSVPEKRTLDYKSLAQSIGVDHAIDWFYELDKQTLAHKIKHAKFTLAPLAACNRNLIQGCNPLKIIESMAYGTPVIATNLPVVKEIICKENLGFLVPPDRPESLGRQMRMLLESPEILKEVGSKSKKYIEKNYLWKYQETKMITVYKSLLMDV